MTPLCEKFDPKFDPAGDDWEALPNHFKPSRYMPIKQLMSWQGQKKRWRKFHKGKWYFVSCKQLGTPPNQQASRTAANSWWLSTLHRLEVQPAPLPSVTTWATVFESWKNLQTITPKSPARIYANIRMAQFFIEFIGLDTPVQKLDEKGWLAFSAHIHSSRGSKGVNHLARIQKTARWLVRFAWETRFLMELPRNLNQRHLFLKTEKSDITVFRIRDILAFFNQATGQAKLHLLLMLNCGFTAVDISSLKEKEIDWDARTIIRKRSKTKSHDRVPTITYPLWPSTYDLLQKHRSGESTVLLTKAGREWVLKSYKEGRYHHSDSVASNFRRIGEGAGVKIYPRGLRATGASNLARHPIFKFYCEHYLGHTPKTVANSHYVQPNQEEFKEAIFWLGERLCIFE